MKKKLVALLIAGAMVVSMVPSVAVFADEVESPASETDESADSTEDEKEGTSKCSRLLADRYELM